MSITLAGIALPDLVLDNEYGWSPVTASVRQTLGGSLVVWEQPRPGRPLDLTGGSDSGWITRATLESLRALAAVPGASYELSYEGTAYTVRFRHEDTALEAVPAVPRPNQQPEDLYHSVRIRLMQV